MIPKTHCNSKLVEKLRKKMESVPDYRDEVSEGIKKILNAIDDFQDELFGMGNSAAESVFYSLNSISRKLLDIKDKYFENDFGK